MSVRAYYDVWCDAILDDGETCGEWCEQATSDDAKIARRRARAYGWKPLRLPDGKRGDCCPDCHARLRERPS